MNKQQEAIEALQQLIKDREAADRNRKAIKLNEEEASVSDWTLTQLRIVAVIKEKGQANNTTLAEHLNISKPAVTKAIKKLLENQMVEKIQQVGNKKEVYYILTDFGNLLAAIHEELHERAEARYLDIFNHFDDHELETLITFFKLMTENIKSL
ncbi:MarR family transcriptional regulator [Oceanobacillus jeddahense]|uniref:MarR family transcriptional regulator n=1 Tax=Oceanobacillus jeddahense TaxID=1462527 RepID=A0ABY5JMY9_9BACI|nr:MarR family transcriptional regulator [Oceanobacillus jeddahense]UUI01180.1 MarR family transcriptional regulator [Oceanobacillus jeddahense]